MKEGSEKLHDEAMQEPNKTYQCLFIAFFEPHRGKSDLSGDTLLASTSVRGSVTTRHKIFPLVLSARFASTVLSRAVLPRPKRFFGA